MSRQDLAALQFQGQHLAACWHHNASISLQKQNGAQQAAAEKLRAFTRTLRQAILAGSDVTSLWKPAEKAAILKARRQESQELCPEKSWASASARVTQVCAVVTPRSAPHLCHCTRHRSPRFLYTLLAAFRQYTTTASSIYCTGESKCCQALQLSCTQGCGAAEACRCDGTARKACNGHVTACGLSPQLKA